MTGSSSNNVMWFKPITIDFTNPQPIKMERVYPCRCGLEHSDEIEDILLYCQHQCYHNSGLVWMHGGQFFCPDCNKTSSLISQEVGDALYPCPICWYMNSQPCENYNMCPSCGTEFGVNDQNATIDELRTSWIKTGPKWWSKSDPEPMNWNPWLQLACGYRIGKVKCIQRVSPEKMNELFESSGIKGQIERGELDKQIIWPPLKKNDNDKIN
jgi:hypothetical protein